MSSAPSNVDLERRLTALEQEVARMKAQTSDPLPWWERIAGAFANDPYYDEAMRLGRNYRRSLKPRGGRRKPTGSNQQAKTKGSRR